MCGHGFLPVSLFWLCFSARAAIGGNSGLLTPAYPAGWLYKPGQAVPGGANGTNYYGPSRGLLYPAMLNWSMYMCPLHRTNTLAWRLSDVKFTSYLMTGCVINGSQSFDWSAGSWGHTYRSTDFKPDPRQPLGA